MSDENDPALHEIGAVVHGVDHHFVTKNRVSIDTFAEGNTNVCVVERRTGLNSVTNIPVSRSTILDCL